MSSKKSRVPLQVSPLFKDAMVLLQGKMQVMEKKKRSLRDLTDDIVNSKILDDVEKIILDRGNINLDIKLRFDSRRKF